MFLSNRVKSESPPQHILDLTSNAGIVHNTWYSQLHSVVKHQSNFYVIIFLYWMYAMCWGILTYTSRSSVVKIDVDNDIQSYVELRYKWFEKVHIW